MESHVLRIDNGSPIEPLDWSALFVLGDINSTSDSIRGAKRRLALWAFRVKGLHRIEIIAAVENIPSDRVAEKAGATREGVLRERLLLHGRRHDGVILSLLRQPA